MKLSIKIPLILFLVSILSTAIVFLLVFSSIRSTLESEGETRQLLLASETMVKIDLFLNERFNDVQAVATRPLVIDALIQKDNFNNSEAERLVASFKQLSTINVSWTDISIIDLSGREILTTDDTKSANILDEDPIYKDLFEKAVKGEGVYSDIFFSEELKIPSIVFLVPVFSDSTNKKVIGLLEAHMDWNAIQNLLEGQKGPLIHLYNRQGFVVATSDFNQKGNVLKEDNSKTPIFQQAIKGDGSHILQGTHNVESLVSHVTEKGYGSYKGNGWILTLETPISVAFAPAESNAIKLGLVAVPIILVATLLTFVFLYRSVIEPIIKLIQTTKDIASGNLEKRVDISTKDEFGILANSFNDMAIKLQDLYKNLENRVKEQTIRLEDKIEEATTAKMATLNVLEDLNEEKNIIEKSKAIDDAILSNMGDGLIATDEKGIVTIINKAAERMLGWSSDEAIGKSFIEVLPLQNEKGIPVPDANRPLKLALQGKIIGSSLVNAYSVTRKNQTKFMVWDIASPVILNHKIIGGVVVFRDVTKEAQVDRMKTEFISLASHQLRTPLSAIKWFVELLNETKMDKDQQNFSNNIAQSTERMIELVNSLLNVSRIESGRIIINPKPTNMGNLVKDIVKGLQPQIDKKQSIIDITVAENLSDINIDPQLIGEVYLNLLTNAIKYTPIKGKIDIAITVKDKDVISQISDTGIGIPEEDKAKVFTKFYRSAEAVKLEPNGNGLGLYLAKAIVESSGGKIWFESNKSGTTFSFSLPLAGSEPKGGEVSLDS